MALSNATTMRLLLLVASVGSGFVLVPPLCALLRLLGLERTNFQGQRIVAGGGLLFVAAGLPWFVDALRDGQADPALALVGFGLLGLLDDLWGTAEFKGFRGHLRALRSGRLTTGLLKAAGGITLALWLEWNPSSITGTIARAALIALVANFFNLLDLRPLRCLKLFWLLGAGLLSGGTFTIWAAFGCSLGYAPWEARRKVMLGDTGSNSLGALVGYAAASRLPLIAVIGTAVLLLAAHMWAERNSFSEWIDRHPWAQRIDQLGRDEKPEAGC